MCGQGFVFYFGFLKGVIFQDSDSCIKKKSQQITMPKYSKDVTTKAKSEIRFYLQKGFKYHDAAKEVSKHFPTVKFLTIRYWAYSIATAEGYYKQKGFQHEEDTEHGNLLQRCEAKLKIQGYKKIIREQNEIRREIEARGSKGNPDLMAINEATDDIVFVEIVEREKKSAMFVDQLERFCKIGKLIVVLPMDTSCTTFWGTQDLPNFDQ